MKTIILIFMILTIVSCKGQQSVSKNDMKKFNIELFNKNKNYLNEYNFSIEPNIHIKQSELEHVFTEDIINKKSVFILKNQYYKNGNIKITGLYFNSSFRKGIYKEYDEQGNLIKEIDYDDGFDYTWEDLLKLLKEREIKIIDRNTTIRKDEGRWHVWYVKGLYVYNIFIDGKTGEILLDDKDVFEEGS